VTQDSRAYAQSRSSYHLKDRPESALPEVSRVHILDVPPDKHGAFHDEDADEKPDKEEGTRDIPQL